MKRLRDSGSGCRMGSIVANAFSYADDIVMLSPSVTALQRLMKICEDFSIEFNMNFNPSKCNVMVFNRSDRLLNVSLKMNGLNIPVHTKSNHLGNEISSVNLINNIDKMKKDMNSRTNVIMTEFNMLNNSSRRFLFNSQCMSSYGSELLNPNERANINSLCVKWRKCCWKILNVSPRTHCNLIPSL